MPSMGYACPVCEAPQADGEHLAHHLALTAMLHGDDHEAWLADRLPDWAERDPSGLAAAVVEGATEVDTESVIEEANLIPGRERTVRDVLATMDERGVLNAVGEDRYLPGEVLLNSDRFDLDFDNASDGGAHRWKSSV